LLMFSLWHERYLTQASAPQTANLGTDA